MENTCCVCFEETLKVTNCNHCLCKTCYSNMYGKKCPMCRQKITKNSYKKIKKVKNITKISYQSELTESEFYREMFLRALQNTDDIQLDLLNQSINQQFQEAARNCPPGQYLDLRNSSIRFTLTQNNL